MLTPLRDLSPRSSSRSSAAASMSGGCAAPIASSSTGVGGLVLAPRREISRPPRGARAWPTIAAPQSTELGGGQMNEPLACTVVVAVVALPAGVSSGAPAPAPGLPSPRRGLVRATCSRARGPRLDRRAGWGRSRPRDGRRRRLSGGKGRDFIFGGDSSGREVSLRRRPPRWAIRARTTSRASWPATGSATGRAMTRSSEEDDERDVITAGRGDDDACYGNFAYAEEERNDVFRSCKTVQDAGGFLAPR
jgi:hypothetical protein